MISSPLMNFSVKNLRSVFSGTAYALQETSSSQRKMTSQERFPRLLIARFPNQTNRTPHLGLTNNNTRSSPALSGIYL